MYCLKLCSRVLVSRPKIVKKVEGEKKEKRDATRHSRPPTFASSFARKYRRSRVRCSHTKACMFDIQVVYVKNSRGAVHYAAGVPCTTFF
jgi:hypothetical protein